MMDRSLMRQNGILNGGIQFKHVKKCLMFLWCNDWVCSDRVLDVALIVFDGMQVFWCVHCE